MKDNFYENPNTDEDRQKRIKKKKKNSAGKVILIIIGLIVIAAAVFLATIKIAEPSFKISSITPQSASKFIDEKVLGKTTTTTTTTKTTTTTAPSTTVPASETTTQEETLPHVDAQAEYLPIEEFKLQEGAKGNFAGNILQGGKVGTDASYIYHIVDGSGIYRFEPNEESYTRVYKSKNALSSINLRGEYIYFVDNGNSNFYRLKKGEKQPEALAQNIKTAYLYDKTIYLFTNDSRVLIMSTANPETSELYSATGDINFIGVSLNAVFFSVTDESGVVNYVTVDNENKKGDRFFRQPEKEGTLVSPVMENGFLYYFEKQDDDSYNLCRQKYGSQKVVTLIKNVTCLSPVITYQNRLYYGELDKSRFKMKELNMNSGDTKTMLYVKDADSENKIIFQHGGEYDFIMGVKNSGGDSAYCASSRFTGDENIMNFKDGKWSY